MRLSASIVYLATVLNVSAAPVHLDFIHEIGGKSILIDSLRYENSRSETFSITRFDCLATDILVTLASGDALVIEDSVAYVPTRGTTFALPSLPEEKITAINFKIGLGKEDNHSDPGKHPTGLGLSAPDKAALIAFLKKLSGPALTAP
jgi:hypothetical protein